MSRFGFFNSTSPPLFDVEDIQELVTYCPPRSEVRKEDNSFDLEHSFLIATISNDYLIKPSWARDEIQRIVKRGTGRVAISLIASELDISEETTISILQHAGDGSFITNDRAYYLTESARFKLAHDLQLALKDSLVDLSHFEKTNGVSRELLLDMVEQSRKGSAGGSEMRIFDTDHAQRYIYSTEFHDSVRESLEHELEVAHQQIRPLNLSLSFPNTTAFAQYILPTLPLAQEGFLESTRHGLLFNPQSYLDHEIDTEIQNLRNGETTYQTLGWFRSRLSRTISGAVVVDKVLQERLGENILVLSEGVVSLIYLDRLLFDKKSSMRSEGWVQIGSESFLTSLPPDDQKMITSWLLDQLQSNPDMSVHVVPLSTSLTRIAVDGAWLEKLDNILRSTVSEDAERQLAKLGEAPLGSPPIEPAFNFSLDRIIESRIPEPVYQFLTRKLSKPAETYFSGAVQRLLTSLTEALADFWIDRVASRVQLYQEAIESFKTSDAKLFSQLRETLQIYTVTDVIPDALARAHSRGLIASKVSVKESVRLKTSLISLQADSDKTMDSLVKHLDTYSRTLNIASPTEEQLSSKNDSMISDLAKKMQRDNDAARLLLSLLILLAANARRKDGQRPGMIYATGKMAPRLLKSLRNLGAVDEKEAETLDGWKEAVKAGKVDNEQKEVMRSWARDIQTGFDRQRSSGSSETGIQLESS